MSNQPVTLIISDRVRPGCVQAYEAWARGIHSAMEGFAGYLGVEVIRPSEPNLLEYVVILRFASYPELKAWEESPVCAEWMAKLQGLLVTPPNVQRTSGLELWFDRPRREQPAPPFYKQVVVATLASYPLIVGFGYLFSGITAGMELWASVAVTVVPISIFITWPVLPWLTRALDFWLYPKAKPPAKTKNA